MTFATTSPLLLFGHLLATCVWVGGLVAIAVATRAARGALPAGAQVAYLRALGRSYGLIGGAALAVAVLTGAALLSRRGRDAPAVATAAIAFALITVTAAGVLQAREMTSLRQRLAVLPEDAVLARLVARGSRRALALRGTIAALTLALLALGSWLAS